MRASSSARSAVIGYCMGGSVAFLSATRLDGVACAVGYYGGQIAQSCDEKPRVPTMLHFGDQDQSIPMTDVEKIKKARPETPIFVYHAATASTATSAPRSTPKRPRSPPAARRNSWPSTSARENPHPPIASRWAPPSPRRGEGWGEGVVRVRSGKSVA